MDPELLETIERGDINSFINLCNTHHHDHEFFLTQTESQSSFFLTRIESPNSSILHILCHKRNQEYIEEALKRLPTQVIQNLIYQTDSEGETPLHHASTYEIAKLLVDAYYRRSFNDDHRVDPPWRLKNNRGELPIQVALRKFCEDVTLYFILLDLDVVCRLPILRDLVSYRLGAAVKTVLTSGAEYSIEGFDPRVDCFASQCIYCLISITEESDALLFLNQHHELFNYMDDSGKMEVLRGAIKCNYVDVVKFILSSYSIDISVSGYELFAAATKSFRPEIAQLIVDDFNKPFKHQVQRKREAAAVAQSLSSRRTSFEIEEDQPLSFHPLWRPPTKMQLQISPFVYRWIQPWETPLQYAIYNKQREFAASVLLWDLAYLTDLAHVYEYQQITPIIVSAEQKGFIRPSSQESSDLKDSLLALHLQTFLQFLRENPDINIATKLIQQYPQLIKLKDASRRAILQYALDENDINTMSFILKIHLATDILHEEQQEEHILTRACRNGNLAAIRAICTICPDSPEAATCHEDLTTVLHVVRLSNLEEYRSLLRIPVIARIKNKTDVLGKSPLMKAIQDDNIYLAQALFEMEGIHVMDIKSKGGETAANMLKDKSNQFTKWETLYKKVKQSTSYVPVGTNLKEMRSTLSVVAALLATITFAAAFTVPGGFDQNNGDVLLGRRASFIVFVLSDTYAMCCSMVVLYSLIWSMVWDSDKALVLIDRSVFVLHQSFYGTLAAFMTGVYTVVSHKSLWLAIVVCVMCCCVPISANRTVLVTILGKFVPTSRPKSNLELEEISIQR